MLETPRRLAEPCLRTREVGASWPTCVPTWARARNAAGWGSRAVPHRDLAPIQDELLGVLERGADNPDRKMANFCRKILELLPWTFAEVAGVEPTNNTGVTPGCARKPSGRSRPVRSPANVAPPRPDLGRWPSGARGAAGCPRGQSRILPRGLCGSTRCPPPGADRACRPPLRRSRRRPLSLGPPIRPPRSVMRQR